MIAQSNIGARVAGALAALLICSALSCDRAFGPAIFNDYDQPVQLVISWQSGETRTVSLDAKTVLFSGQPDSKVSRVALIVDEQECWTLDREGIEEWARVADSDAVGFLLSPAGFRLLTRQELAELNRRYQ